MPVLPIILSLMKNTVLCDNDETCNLLNVKDLRILKTSVLLELLEVVIIVFTK